MPSSSPHRLLYLDGWRGIAILCVLVGHFFQIRGINPGRLGVELFFVLSGRLMATILFIEQTSLPEFYRRRFSRIYPALLVFVLTCTAYVVEVHRENFDPRVLAGSLLFYSNYLVAVGQLHFPNFEHIWSLSIEEHSYILLSLLTLAALRWRRQAAAIIGGVALLAIVNGALQTYLLHGDYYQVFWRTDVRMASILMSAALCVHLQKVARCGGDRWLLPIGLIGVLLNLNPIPDVVKYSVGTLCLAYVINRAAYLPPTVLRIMSCKPLVMLGVTSYSLYLWQQPFFHAAATGGPRWLLLLGALITGTLSYHLIEQPARAWLNRRRLPGSARPNPSSSELIQGPFTAKRPSR